MSSTELKRSPYWASKPPAENFTFSTKEEELELLSGEMLNEDLIKYYSGKKNPLFDVFVITLNDKKEEVFKIGIQACLVSKLGFKIR